MTTIPKGTKFLGIVASVDTTEKRSKLNNSYQEYYTIGDITDYTQEAIVNISSAQILAMGSTPIELLPAPGVGMYYDIEKVILEYTYGTTAYLLADETLMLALDNELGFIFKDIITINIPGNPRYAIWSSNNPSMSTNGYIYVQPLWLNNSLTITSDNSSDPTLGDGTLRAIITYNVRTFGA